MFGHFQRNAQILDLIRLEFERGENKILVAMAESVATSNKPKSSIRCRISSGARIALLAQQLTIPRTRTRVSWNRTEQSATTRVRAANAEKFHQRMPPKAQVALPLSSLVFSLSNTSVAGFIPSWHNSFSFGWGDFGVNVYRARQVG